MPSPVGKFAFACSHHDRCNIWYFDYGIDESRQVTYGDSWKDQPDWSPCGNWITYLCDSSGCPEVFKIELTDHGIGTPTALTNRNHWCDSPRFSPDGSRISFVSSGLGPSHVWSMRCDGSDLQQLTSDNADDSHVEWHPSGEAIYWSRHGLNGNADVCRMNLANGEIQNLSRELSTDVAPSISPCGRFVAFLSNRQVNSRTQSPLRHRSSDVWMMRSDGTESVKLTDGQSCVGSLTWHPQGRELYFMSRDVAAPPRLRRLDVADLCDAYLTDDRLRLFNAADTLRCESRSGALPSFRMPLPGTVRSPRWLRSCPDAKNTSVALPTTAAAS